MTAAKSYQMTAENEFNKHEAFELIDQMVRKEAEPGADKNNYIDNIGVVCGVLVMNEEVEVVVKFFSGVRQYTKSEFEQDLVKIFT